MKYIYRPMNTDRWVRGDEVYALIREGFELALTDREVFTEYAAMVIDGAYDSVARNTNTLLGHIDREEVLTEAYDILECAGLVHSSGKIAYLMGYSKANMKGEHKARKEQTKLVEQNPSYKKAENDNLIDNSHKDETEEERSQRIVNEVMDGITGKNKYY
ncbi:hypothetical protein AGMMS49992_07460 [Clostridia bacterium]|nr:hypothetical protein AGMMS49992_07460 [Clostridia bacterium]